MRPNLLFGFTQTTLNRLYGLRALLNPSIMQRLFTVGLAHGMQWERQDELFKSMVKVHGSLNPHNFREQKSDALYIETRRWG